MFRLPSIRSKLLAIFLVTGAAPIAAVSLIAYFNSIRAVEDMVGNRTQGLARAVQAELTRKLEQRLADEVLVVNRPVQDFLSQDSPGRNRDGRDVHDQLLQYVPLLFEKFGAYYDDLVLADSLGTPMFKFHRSEGAQAAWALQRSARETIPLPGAPRAPGGSPVRVETAELTIIGIGPGQDSRTDRPLPWRMIAPPSAERTFTEEDRLAAIQGETLLPGETRLIADIPLPGGEPGLRMVRPVFSTESPPRRLGTLVAILRRDYVFRSDLASERFGERGELAVLDRQSDTFVFHSRSEFVGKAAARVDPELTRALRTARDPDSDAWRAVAGEGDERLVVAETLAGVPWTVVASAVPREFQREALNAGILNLAVASGAILVASLILLVASGRISQSIRTLTRGAREIASGNLDHSIEVLTHDEIQVLGENFNHMRESLKNNIALRERAARDLEALNRTLEDRVRERTRELENLNEVLNQANQELKELDRLKTSFLATVSHEFKTPLTSIKAFAEILLDEAEDGEGATGDTVRFLGIINKESERLSRLIRNLLSLSQIESGRMAWSMTDFPLRDVLNEAVDGLWPVLQENDIQVVNEVGCPRARVHGDRDRIQEVVTNLIENAIKFIDGDRRIVLRCGPPSDSPGFVQISVQDFGCGFDPHHQEVIFDRFSQVDPSDTRKRGGTGLGLAISREIVEHHGGRIWAEGISGQGATFHFTLPLAATAGEDGPSSSRDGGAGVKGADAAAAPGPPGQPMPGGRSG